jgi:hypothetical protein
MYNRQRGSDVIYEGSSLTQKPSTSNAAGIIQDARARRVETQRRYHAKKREEWLTKLRGITSTEQNTEIASTVLTYYLFYFIISFLLRDSNSN